MSEQAIEVGVIGYGTVGQGVVRLLNEKADSYTQLLGKPISVRRVLVRNKDKALKAGGISPEQVTTDPDDFFMDPEIDIVVEVMGGVDMALLYVNRALVSGRHVVTANKALLAKNGAMLCETARDNQVSIGFEASCAGGLPLITALQFGLKANAIQGLYGILNGTCNFILTKMSQEGVSYEAALKEAQDLGFAEADPTLDVSGVDAAQKLTILSTMAFGAKIHEKDVMVKGIEGLQLADITAGQEMGYTLKLIACAERVGDGLSFSVAPSFVREHSMMGDVNGPFNAMAVYGDAVGQTFYYGRGAGQDPTASAVVSDLLNTASGWYTVAFKEMNRWLDARNESKVSPFVEHSSRFYLRILAKDQPGVVAQFSTILGEEGVSLAAVMQHEGQADGFVPVVIITHDSPVGSVMKAAERINQLDAIAQAPVCLRILDLPSG